MARDELSERTLDATVNKVFERLSEKGVYGAAMEGLDPKHRRELEKSMDRHAERQRKQSKTGW
jgi:hypothetical protein